jgi:hypothetical protein
MTTQLVPPQLIVHCTLFSGQSPECTSFGRRFNSSISKLRDWFIEFEQARWDKQLENDSDAGKLDFLINAALAEHEAGLTRDL